MLRHSLSKQGGFATTFARAFANSVAEPSYPLHNSMSDGFYDIKNAPTMPTSSNRPLARPPPRSANSLSEPELLHNSMSDGLYEYRRTMLSSMSEPEYLHNSMSDAFYDVSRHSRTASAMKRGQGYRSGSSRNVVQRVVSRSSVVEEPGILHNSFSHGDYTPRKR